MDVLYCPMPTMNCMDVLYCLCLVYYILIVQELITTVLICASWHTKWEKQQEISSYLTVLIINRPRHVSSLLLYLLGCLLLLKLLKALCPGRWTTRPHPLYIYYIPLLPLRVIGNICRSYQVFSSPCQRQCELLPSLGVHRLSSVNFSHFNLFLWNPSAKWTETW